MKENNFNLFTLGDIIKRWKKLIIGAFLLSLIVSTIVAFLLPVYYKSVVIFYPFDPRSYDPRFALVKSPGFGIYAGEQEVERILAVGESRELAFYMIEKFNLYQRYNIKKSEAKAEKRVFDEFMGQVTIKKTPLAGGLEVIVFDRDAKIAADMANEIIKFIDKKNREPISIINNQILRGYLKSQEEKVKDIQKLIENLKPNQNYTAFNTDFLANEYIYNYTKLSDVQQELKVLDEKIETLYILEPAKPALDKAKPVKALVILIGIVGTMIIIFIIISIAESFSKREG